MTKATELLVEIGESALRELECHYSKQCALEKKPIEQCIKRLRTAIEDVRKEADEDIPDKYTVEYLDIYGVWHKWSEERFMNLGHARRVFEEVQEKQMRANSQKFWIRLRQKNVIEDTVMQAKIGDWG